jgi:hypothetical protein
MPFSRGTSENSILFFQGGHKHDGVSSSLIDVTKYSIYDFVVGKTGDSARQAAQQKNYDSLKGVISSIITTDILGPSGVRLGPNSVQSVNISAGAVTASELAANIVLVNNVISSSNFNGTVAANGVITGQGTTGWAITSAGDAVFSNTAIRGTLTAGSLYINANNQWSANGTVVVGNPGDVTPGFFYSPSAGLVVTGRITATSGKIAAFEVQGATLYTGDSFVGWIALGPVDDAAYGGVPAGEILVATRAPSDNHEVYTSMRGEKFLIQDVNDETRYTEITRDGMRTTGTMTADSFVAPSVVYPYGANQIAFYWDGSQIYAVIDGQNQICLTHCGSGPAPGVGSVTPAVATVDPVNPGGDCPTCPTHVEPCCPPAACGYDEVKLGHFCL